MSFFVYNTSYESSGGRAPIFRLPEDILLDIFLHCFQDYPSHFNTLSRVCRTWRNLIHTRPIFWSCIALNFRHPQANEKAIYWLTRAGSCPLSLSLIFSHRGLSRDVETEEWILSRLAKICRTLQPHLDRMTLISLSCLSPHLTLISELLSGSTPRLVDLHVQNFGNNEDAPFEEPLPIFMVPFDIPTDCSSKVDARFYSCIPRFPSSFGSSVATLYTDLGCGRSTDDVLAIIELCPHLREFHLRGHIDDAIEESQREAVVLPELSSLHISQIEDVENLIFKIQVSSLTSLSISEVDWAPEVVDALLLLLQSNPRLSTIEIRTEYHDIFDVEDIVPPHTLSAITLPFVTEFSFTAHALTLPLLLRLNLPSLETLELECAPYEIVYHIASHSDKVQKMVLARYRSQAPQNQQLLMPALELLVLQNSTAILDHIHTPHLKTLHIFDLDRSRNPGGRLFRFLNESAPPLHTLRLSLKSKGEAFNPCWEKLPELIELTLGNDIVDDAILAALSSRSLVPNLKIIDLTCDGHVSPQRLVELYSSRNLDEEGNMVARVTGAVGFNFLAEEYYMKLQVRLFFYYL